MVWSKTALEAPELRLAVLVLLGERLDDVNADDRPVTVAMAAELLPHRGERDARRAVR